LRIKIYVIHSGVLGHAAILSYQRSLSWHLV
jgi:hypothetical protein